MAVVGEAFIVVRPITAGFEGSVKRDLNKITSAAQNAGSKAGKQFGGSFAKAFSSDGGGIFSSAYAKKAASAQSAFASLQRQAITTGTALSVLAGTAGSLISAIVSLGASVAAAAPSVVALGSAFVSLGIGAAVAKLALGGVGKALSALNKQDKKAAKDTEAQEDRVKDAKKALLRVIERNGEAAKKFDEEFKASTKKITEAQLEFNDAVEKGNEQIQQLGFDAEDAALAEKKAALELDKARETLQRTQDLPPNSRARKEAELAYAEAELNLRKAKDANSDLAKEQDRLSKTGVAGTDVVISAQEKLNSAYDSQNELVKDRQKEIRDGVRAELDGKEDVLRAEKALKKAQEGDTGDDPLAGLTESQKEFVRLLRELKPKVEELKKAASDAFLPKLGTAIKKVADEAFPTIKTGVAVVGDALGDAAISIAKAITDSGNLKDLATAFENAATNIRTIGEIVGKVWGILLSVLKAAQPVTERFLGWLNKSLGKFETYLDTEEGAKKLEDFFTTAGNVAKEIGDVFREAFGALGVVIKANVGPGTGGQILLDYFEDVLEKFKTFGKTVDGQKSLKDYFAAAATNATDALSAIGKYGTEIIKAGADPNIGKFWKNLGEGSESFGNILTKTNEAAPKLATLITKLIKITDLLTDAGTNNAFFDTLNKAASALIKVLENDAVAAIMKFLAPITGALLALGLLATILSTIAAIFVGVLLKGVSVVIGAFKLLWGIVRLVVGVFQVIAFVFGTTVAVAAAVVVAILAVVAIFVILYKKNEAFRELVDKVWNGIKDAIGAAWEFIKDIFGKIAEVGAKIWDFILDGLKLIWSAVEAYFKTIFNFWKAIVEIFIGIGLIIWNFLFDKIQEVWALVSGWWNNTILPFITAIVTKVAEFGAMIWNWIYDKIMTVWTTVKGFWDTTIYPFVSGIVNAVKTRAGAIWDFISGTISGVWAKVTGFFTNTIYPFISGIGANIAKFAKGMWDGLKNGLESVVNFIIRGVNLIIKGINLLIKAANAVKIGDDIKEIRDILPVNFAKGGIVYPSQGGTIARVAEAGRPERIEPLDPDGLSKRDKAMITLLSGKGGGGMNVNVYGSEGMNINELAAIVSRKIAFQMNLGAIS